MLKEALKKLDLESDAIDWLCSLYKIIQFIDDVQDGDKADVESGVWNSIVFFPTNGFFLRNIQYLSPILSVQILKWMASDEREREGKANAKTYMYRAGFYDVVMEVVLLTHGYKKAKNYAPIVMDTYGETLEDYIEEFKNA